MNLDDLRALIAVADTGSLLAAAESLRVSRATLRRRIADLEGHAGAQLLRPTRQGAALTPAGVEVLARGRALLQDAALALHAARGAGPDGLGELVVAAPVGMPPLAVAGLVAAARRKAPEVQLRLRFYNDPTDCAREEVHVILHFGLRVPRGAWVTTVLARLEERLLATQSYLDAHGTPARPADLAGHTLLSWLPADEPTDRWPVEGAAPLPVRPVLVSADVHAVRQCAGIGLGIVRAPDAPLPVPTGELEPLVPILTEHFHRPVVLRALVPEGIASLPQSRRVMGIIRSFISGE